MYYTIVNQTYHIIILHSDTNISHHIAPYLCEQFIEITYQFFVVSFI